MWLARDARLSGAPPDPSRLDDVEMGRVTPGARPEGAPPRRALENAFFTEYSLAGPSKRAVFEKYLPALGVSGILDFLEFTFPFCHAEAHELGRAVFARFKTLGPALREGAARCTAGCMHGILMEAFGSAQAVTRGADRHVTLEDARRGMLRVCHDPEMVAAHRPGNCAHGIGHALMAMTGHDVAASLGACASFGQPAMEYYCATGVFMESLVPGNPEELTRRPLHFPCDTGLRFPAACYRYKAHHMLRALRGSAEQLVAECLALSGPRRLGCFHGVGAVHVAAVAEDAQALARVCRRGTPDDQAMCIEGAIEKLGDFHEPRALDACATLEGRNAVLCQAAARGKMYRLDKPTLALYVAREGDPPAGPPR